MFSPSFLRTGAAFLLCVGLSASLPALQPGRTITFAEPLDALSLRVSDTADAFAVRAKTDAGWSDWTELAVETNEDPTSRETNLVVFPETVRTVELRGPSHGYELHPIAVSKEPPHIAVAAREGYTKPRILTRSQWGANESLTVTSDFGPEDDSSEKTDQASAHAIDCPALQEKYPAEFSVTRTETSAGEDLRYLWPREYSPAVNMLVVHHTAAKVAGDKRPAVERVRAIYQYHAKSKGWGDIGYHFVVDEEGQIYEGKGGGDYVVGGHAYCHNVGTVGISMLGNFEVEQPTQEQIKSLQWLLKYLSDKYDIDLAKNTTIHGKTLPAIVGHKDIIPTSCPGFYAYGVLDQVRKNVRRGVTDASVTFPAGPTGGTSSKPASWYNTAKGLRISAAGNLDLRGRPDDQQRVSLEVTAGTFRIERNDRLAEVVRSDSRIGIWQDAPSGGELRVRQEIISPRDVRGGETMTVRLRMQLPKDPGLYTVQIGNITYTLTVDGRSLVPKTQTPTRQTSSRSLKPRLSASSSSKHSSLLPSNLKVRSRPKPALGEGMGPNIRVHLSYALPTATLQLLEGAYVNKTIWVPPGTVTLAQKGQGCSLVSAGRDIAFGTVQISPANGISTITSWDRPWNAFRGIIECRVMDGALTLINELPLDEYLMGLGEEPDTQAYEKQRAFAVAARSYAAYYLSPNQRKFPGKPYDGDDSPARFQFYAGYNFEGKNPRWLQAVASTKLQVIKKDGQIVKTPYFSSDDGRTRSPAEVGWGSYPFAEVFSSKDDPWCKGKPMAGHGVGMSGCGATGQANEGWTGEEILQYYYPTTEIAPLD